MKHPVGWCLLTRIGRHSAATGERRGERGLPQSCHSAAADTHWRRSPATLPRRTLTGESETCLQTPHWSLMKFLQITLKIFFSA